MRPLAALVVMAVASLGQGLKDVKAIYVDSLGNAEGAEMIREKVINRLAKSQSVSVVLDIEKADAILTGVGEVSTGYHHTASVGTSGGSAQGGTTYDATVAIRLITKDKQILWADEAKPARFFTRSVSSSVADKVVRNLLKAIENDRKPKK
jgi:hypothetical protein